MTYQSSTNNYQISKYIVDPTAIDSPYNTIQSAIDAANAAGGGLVVIRRGTYTENLTLYSGVDLQGDGENTSIIIGTHACPVAGTLNIYDLTIQGNNCIQNVAPCTCNIFVRNCIFNVAGSSFDLSAYSGTLHLENVTTISANDAFLPVATTTPTVIVQNSSIGGNAGTSIILDGTVTFDNVYLNSRLIFLANTTAILTDTRSASNFVNGSGLPVVLQDCEFLSQAANSAIIHNGAGTLTLTNVVVDSAVNPSIGGVGAGNVIFGSVIYLNDANVAGTLTKSYATRTETGVLKLDDTTAGALIATAGVVSGITPLTVALGGTGIVSPTDHSLIVGSGAAAMTEIAVGATGTILTGVTGGDPTWTTATYPATAAVGDIFYGSALNTISSLAFDNTVTRYLANTGGAGTLPGWDQVNLTNGVTGTLPVGSGGTGVVSITDHALIVGSGAAAVTEIGPLTNGQLVVGSTGADPVAASLTQPAAGLTITGGAGTITFALANDLAGIEALATTGLVSRTAADTYAATTITQNAILIGAAGELPANLGPLTNGQLPIGSTGAAPVAASLTQPAAGVTITGGAGSITFALADDLAGIEALATTGIVSRTAADTYAATTITQHAVLIGAAGELPTNLGPLTDGQLVIGSTGVAPVAATLTAGAGVGITNGAGSITIGLTGGALGWTAINANQALAVNNGYICTGGAGLSLSLPAASAVGDMIVVALDGSTSWTITQGANQQIRIGNQTTTLGAGGSLASTAQGNTVTMVCVTTNLTWIVVSSIGNITVV